jgi:acylglycerol lipase
MSMQTEYNVISYKDKPRLRTAVELLRTTQEIEQKLEYVCSQLLTYLSPFSCDTFFDLQLIVN